MTDTLIVRCECGSFSAEADLHQKESNIHIVCYCDDCQSYSRHLGNAEKILLANGGTEIIQLSPAHFRLVKGKEHLGALRLSPNGLLRFYATCCNTPICNAPANPSMPYLALFTRNLKKLKKSAKGKSSSLITRSIDNLIGPVSFGVGAGNLHPIEADWPVAKGFGFRGLFGTLRNIARWRLRGDHKRSELLDWETGEPLVTPYVLSVQERNIANQT